MSIATLSHKKYEFHGFRKSTSPQNRQPEMVKQIVKQKFEDFAGEMTFSNPLIGILCEMRTDVARTVAQRGASRSSSFHDQLEAFSRSILGLFGLIDPHLPGSFPRQNRRILEKSKRVDRSESNPGANEWFLRSTPIQMPPRRGDICGRLTQPLPSTRLQGGLRIVGYRGPFEGVEVLHLLHDEVEALARCELRMPVLRARFHLIRPN